MNSTALVIALFLLSAASGAAQSSAVGSSGATGQQSADEQTLRDIDRRLLEAVIAGNRDFFEKLLADDAVITDRNGRVTTKAEGLKTFRPLPDLKFALTRQDVRVIVHGDAAVINARSVGTVQAGTQTIRVDERSTDMYARIGGTWRLVAGHTSDIPAERVAVRIDPKIYLAYVGEYELTPAVTLSITNAEGKLMIQPMSEGRPAGPESQLLPASETTFFTQGQAGETIFIRDDQGIVTHLIIRGGAQDIKVRKVR